jgi:two-component system cell cycle response regulator DivK
MDRQTDFCYNVGHAGAEAGVALAWVRGQISKSTDVQRGEIGKEMTGPRILYIEDNRDNRILVRRVLVAEGYDVVEAEDGWAGLRAAQAGRFDLILVDINLPEVDGYEVTARLKALDTVKDVPIVAITANVMKGDREKTLAAGCSGYIQKPIDVDLLPMQLAAFLER